MEVSDEQAVALARGGDQDAFRVLVDRHSRSVYRLAYRMTGNPNDTEDVVQETWLRAWRRLGRFEARAGFGTWLYRIAANCSLDLIRVRERQGRASSFDDGGVADTVAAGDPGPDRLAISDQVHRKLAEAMAALSPMERAAFVLRHFEGRSIEEIGEALGREANATKNCVFRAVAKLRRALEPVVSGAPCGT